MDKGENNPNYDMDKGKKIKYSDKVFYSEMNERRNFHLLRLTNLEIENGQAVK